MAPIMDKISKSWLRWFRYVQYRPISAQIPKKNYYINDGAVMVKCEVHLLAKASRTLGTTHFQNNEVNFKTVINKQ